ncbi:hypothetical protein P4O66_001598 [Electrophorus voltai]|uniref:Uncharacterized protein n=1 Tax=Electrophorus voltai TaxID=2609070 RepID=A0AAD8Z514_9TELE|nr:hypothetical protein P4O66_001598 [Electrophorus voltai]
MARLPHTVLLLALTSLASSRLVADFLNNNGCPQFFLKTARGHVTPPVLRNPHHLICQRYMGQDRFATLYDTRNKIPTYSAYLYVPHVHLVRANQWWTEPDLTKHNQAQYSDYQGSGKERGHLYPAYQNNNNVQMDATFTLTNAAPQDDKFNKAWFHNVESKLAQQITKCTNQVYIITGVVPSNADFIKNKVNVPSYFWTAYCCLDNNYRLVASGGYIASWNGQIQLQSKSILDLEKDLASHYHIGAFPVFGGLCYGI